MSLENLVPDVESCKKLPMNMETALVVVNDSLIGKTVYKRGSEGFHRLDFEGVPYYPAPTAQELMAIMPIKIRDKQKGWFRRIGTSRYKNSKGQVGFYEEGFYAEYNEIKRISNPNLAQALCDLYNRCVDEGHIEKEVVIVLNMEYFHSEYEKASSWRARWNRLSLKSQEGGRLAVTQEYIERRAKIANRRVANIMKLYDEVTKD